jgi:transposase InsO family protein
MAWERKNWIERYQAGERISDLAAEHRVSRKTLYKWVARFEEWGEQGLEELSRAPHQHAGAVDGVWRERVLAERDAHPRWGAEKLRWRLAQQHAPVPSASTIGRLLRENGRVRRRERVARAQGTGTLAAAGEPNQVWCIDFKGWFRTGDGVRCEPLTISDYATRYLLCCQGLSSTRSELVRPVMERVFATYGVPERIRSDNGPPFASTGGCGLTELSAWWIELGIVCERIQPGCPQQNGRQERMHRTLSEATLEPPATTARQQQRRFEAFREEYNHRRPHQALALQVPAALYVGAERPYWRVTAEPEYGKGWEVRAVTGGESRWKCERVFVSHALNGKRIGFEPVEEGLWKVWFYRQWLGMWDERRLYRPQEWERKQLQAHPRDAS